MRAGAVVCLALAATSWFATSSAFGATTLGPTKTAWYDNSGAQQVTGEQTPSAAQSGQLEVSYAPAGVAEPQQNLPPAPAVPGSPVGAPSGQVGGKTVGDTLAFATVEYAVPLNSQGQSVDPSSITATLSLALDSSTSANVSSGDLVACPTSSPLWSAGGDQDSGQAPSYSCGSGQAVTGNVSGNTVSFAVTSQQESTLEQGVFSLAIVPGSSPSGAFQAVIDPPGATSFGVTNESPLSNANSNLAGSEGSSSTAPSSVGSASDVSSEFGLSPFSPASTPAQQGASPASSPSGTSSPATGGSVPGRLAAGSKPAPAGGLGASAQRTMAVLLLLGLGALLAVGSSRRVHVPHSLRQVSTAASA